MKTRSLTLTVIHTLLLLKSETSHQAKSQISLNINTIRCGQRNIFVQKREIYNREFKSSILSRILVSSFQCQTKIYKSLKEQLFRSVFNLFKFSFFVWISAIYLGNSVLYNEKTNQKNQDNGKYCLICQKNAF